MTQNKRRVRLSTQFVRGPILGSAAATASLSSTTGTVSVVSLTGNNQSLGTSSTISIYATPQTAGGIQVTGQTVTWSSASLSIASPGPDSATDPHQVTVYSGLTLGTTTLTATCNGVQSSVATVSVSAGAFNRPVSHNTLLNLSMDTTVGLGFATNSLWNDPTYLSVVSRTDGPESPPNSYRFSWPAGFTDTSPAAKGSKGYTPVREVYVRVRHSIDTPWDYHDSGTNKLFYIGIQGSLTDNEITCSVVGTNQNTAVVKAGCNVAGMSPPSTLPNNVFSGSTYTLGDWHLIECLMTSNSLTAGVPNSDGTLKLWVNGTLYASYTTMKFNTTVVSSTTVMFSTFNLNPTWGGQNSTPKAQTDYMYFDHIYVSGI